MEFLGKLTSIYLHMICPNMQIDALFHAILNLVLQKLHSIDINIKELHMN